MPCSCMYPVADRPPVSEGRQMPSSSSASLLTSDRRLFRSDVATLQASCFPDNARQDTSRETSPHSQTSPCCLPAAQNRVLHRAPPCTQLENLDPAVRSRSDLTHVC